MKNDDVIYFKISVMFHLHLLVDIQNVYLTKREKRKKIFMKRIKLLCMYRYVNCEYTVGFICLYKLKIMNYGIYVASAPH